ncbi:protein DEK [Myripristis murdjan]|uniref:Protein DEK n=1 Tax=Myripristis murdjan TaxID=586833 RepID=A0A667Y7M6_9TELE|nr:protein DEK [Myripristis murdjan]XP_029928688.1 protein DEK [Myripristis murdjan]XP_029928689.1 protein DEK [Myripristis murdjan]
MTDEAGADVSEVAEEPMESSAVSEEDVEEQPSPKKGFGKSFAVAEIIEGKRAKKTIERLNFQMPKPKEKLKIEDGGGDKLGDIPRTNYHIGRMKPADLKPLHTILFDRPGKMATMRKNMRLFNGFPFDADSEAYTKKREKLLRTSSFTNSKLRGICKVLDLEKKGTQSDLIDRILTFLIAPKNSGKPLSKKKKKSKKKLSGSDSKSSTKKKSKPKPRSSSSSPKKAKAGSKSKAIVMDSSSDDDSDEEDDKAGAAAEAEGSDAEDKPSEKDEKPSDESEESAEEEDEEDEDEDESPKSKPGKGKAAPKKSVKRPRTPSKKSAPPKKRAKKDVSEESESDADSDTDEKPRKKAAAKRAAQAKPAAKTKKADSSSNSKKTASTVTEDSTDDDEPLIKIIKKAPSDEQLKETVQSLLKEANLEEMTMKQICQRVYDTYPDHDLTSRKDYIKQTVKSLIT